MTEKDYIYNLSEEYSEARKIEKEKVDLINKAFHEETGFNFAPKGKNIILGAIRKHGFDEVLKSTYISIDQYFYDDDDAQKTFDFIEKICGGRKKLEKDHQFLNKSYIRGMLNNLLDYYDQTELYYMLNSYLTSDNDFKTFKDIAVNSDDWEEFCNLVRDIYGEGF